jgi:hypothetical protein
MKPTHIHESIAQQIDHMRPVHLKPGKHIGIEILDETAITVTVIPTGVKAIVRYQQGPDLYDVEVTNHEGDSEEFERVYCDQLGDLIFGVDGEAWSQPFGAIITWDANGERETRLF